MEIVNHIEYMLSSLNAKHEKTTHSSKYVKYNFDQHPLVLARTKEGEEIFVLHAKGEVFKVFNRKEIMNFFSIKEIDLETKRNGKRGKVSLLAYVNSVSNYTCDKVRA